MCVILQIEKGVTVPADKLARACDINANGYGISYATKDGLKVIRSIKNNDPKEVQDHLDKLKDRRVFVHLRYATVGGVTLENNHPFIVLSHKKAADIAFMHNGTISSYSPKKDDGDKCSDTQLFARDLVAPAAERSAAFLGSNKVLADPIFRRLVDLEAGVSVLVLFDRWGNVLRVNENRGKQFDGWWASNDYSFDDKHMRSSARTTWTQPRGRMGPQVWTPHRQRIGLPWEEDKLDAVSDAMAESWRKETATKHILPFAQSPHTLTKSVPYHKDGFLRLTTEAKFVAEKVNGTKSRAADNPELLRNLTVPRTTFIEMAGMHSLDDLGTLTTPDMEELCKNYPAAMSQMFVDLYGELRDLKLNNVNQARTILALTADKRNESESTVNDL